MKRDIEKAIDKVVEGYADDSGIESEQEAISELEGCIQDLQCVVRLSRSDKLTYLRNVRKGIMDLIEWWV